jgi:hypothetical protein
MTAIVAIAAVVSFALYFRDSGVEIVLDKEGRVTLDFADNQVDFADLLDRVLAADDGQSSEKVLAEAILENRGYYHVTNVRLVDALRALPPSDDNERFTAALRELLYDLQGPFARPYTFAGADDDRLLDALKDLDPKTTNGDPQAVSPLLSGLWRMSLNVDDLFRPRPINATIREADDVAPEIARACVNSLLDQKQITIVSGGVMKTAFVRADRLCPQPPPSARELLAGMREVLFMAPDDVADVTSSVQRTANDDGRPPSLEVEVMVSPKYFGQLMPAASNAP